MKLDRNSPTTPNREAHMYEMDFSYGTLADEKLKDPNSVGTASDHAGVTIEAHKRRRR
jgi:hypothetical protein